MEEIVNPESINLSEWYDPTKAAQIISKNSGKAIKAEYVRKLSEYGKIRKVKISNRASLYWKEDVDKYRVEERGVKSGRAKKKAAQSKDENAA